MLKTEYEVKFYLINKNELIKKLLTLNAKLNQKETLMRRFVYSLGPQRWLRLRDEGNKVTLTIKEEQKKSIEGMKEATLIINNNFDEAHNFLKNLNLSDEKYEENFRETWILNDSVITIDRWPNLDPFIEIEGTNAEQVTTVAHTLGFQMKDALYGTVTDLYKHNHKKQ